MKYIGRVKISNVDDARSKAEELGTVYDNGAIFVEVPELNLEGDENILYCQYGLSLPYYKVKDGDEVLIEPTVGNEDRWFFTGIVDCGRSSISPTSDDQIIIENEAGLAKIKIGDLEINFDSDNTVITIGTNTKIEVIDDEINIEEKDGAKINLKAKEINIIPGPGGFVNLGASPSQFCNNLPNCIFSGAPHSTSIDTKV